MLLADIGVDRITLISCQLSDSSMFSSICILVFISCPTKFLIIDWDKWVNDLGGLNGLINLCACIPEVLGLI